jgi:glycosyltransferase involved in cell wall biosynthesis
LVRRARDVGEHRRLVDPHILAVSTLHPHNNLDGLMRAYSEFRKTQPEFRLIIVGLRGLLHNPRNARWDFLPVLLAILRADGRCGAAGRVSLFLFHSREKPVVGTQEYVKTSNARGTQLGRITTCPKSQVHVFASRNSSRMCSVT